jgi:pyruvate/2-oxoglutarate dehydrogenase complex dihydrolipoamide acyltransferase (E2) component
MSWDAVILKVQGPFRSIEEVADEDYLPLGSIASVAERIRAAFPNAEWSSPIWATWRLDDNTGVTIDLEGVESSHSILVSVSGSGNPIPHLLAVARANDWVVLDCSTTEFLNPDEASTEGWDGYQSLMGSLPEPIPGSVDQAPPQAPQQPPPQPPPPAAPEPPPSTPKKKQAAKPKKQQAAKPKKQKAAKPKKQKAAKRVKRKVKRQTVAKKSRHRKKGLKKKVAQKRNPKKKVPGKKGSRKKTAKKKK